MERKRRGDRKKENMRMERKRRKIGLAQKSQPKRRSREMKRWEEVGWWKVEVLSQASDAKMRLEDAEKKMSGK